MRKLLNPFLFTLLMFVNGALAQSLSADQILDRADDVVNEAPDMEAMVEMVLVESSGGRSTRETEMYQKGTDYRLIRFLTPADQRGIGFLSLPDNVNYLYLPAFDRIRRIASHVENENFAGTDFSYDDLSSFRFSEKYEPSLSDQDSEFYILELTPKSGISTDYSKLMMWVRLDNYYPTRIEYYNRSGELWKVLEQKGLRQISGYWIAIDREMTDMLSGHSTSINMTDVEVNTGLDVNIFSQRYLMRLQ